VDIYCNRSDLNNAVGLAQRAISNTLFGKEDRIILIPHFENTPQLEIIGNNPIFGYFVTIPILESEAHEEEIKEFNPIVVDAGLFSKIIKRGTESERVKLTLYEDDFEMKVTIGSFISKLRGYAELPFSDEKRKAEVLTHEFIPSDILCRLIKATCWAAAEDVKMPHLQVCEINIMQDFIEVVATDKYVIARANATLPESVTDSNTGLRIYISSDVGNELSGMSAENSDLLTIAGKLLTLNKRKDQSEIYLETSLVKVNYPDINDYLENIALLNQVVLDRDLFAETLNRMCINLTNNIFPVLLEYKAEDKKIYFKDTRKLFELYESMPVKRNSSKDFVCAFDIKKMLAALKGASIMSDEDTIVLQYNGERQPISILADNYAAYIMVINTDMLNN